MYFNIEIGGLKLLVRPVVGPSDLFVPSAFRNEHRDKKAISKLKDIVTLLTIDDGGLKVINPSK